MQLAREGGKHARPSIVLCIVLAAAASSAVAQTLEPMTSAWCGGGAGTGRPGLPMVHQSLHPPGVRLDAGPGYPDHSQPGRDDWSSTVDCPRPAAARGGGRGERRLGRDPDGKYILSWWSTQPVVLSTGPSPPSPAAATARASARWRPVPASARTARSRSRRRWTSPVTGQRRHRQLRFGQPDLHGRGAQRGWQRGLRRERRTVPPKSVLQVRVNEQGVQLGDVGSVTVRCTDGCDGTAFAYASVVVNDSNDAYFMYAAAAAGASVVAPVATVRDRKDTWFITGGTLYDVFEAMGYAVATDRLWQAETYRRRRAHPGRGVRPHLPRKRRLPAHGRLLRAGAGRRLREPVDRGQDRGPGVHRRVQPPHRRGPRQPAAAAVRVPGGGPDPGFTFLPAPWTTSDVLAWIAMLQRLFDPRGWTSTARRPASSTTPSCSRGSRRPIRTRPWTCSRPALE